MPGYKRWKSDRQGWELVVPLPRDPVTGRRRSRSVLFRGSALEADRELARLFVASESDHVTRDATLEQLLGRWLELVEADLSPTTVREYRRLIRVRIVPALGDVRLQDLGPERLDTFYRATVAGGLSNALPGGLLAGSMSLASRRTGRQIFHQVSRPQVGSRV